LKKVTIITLPEYESLILESMGDTGVTQLKEVTGPEFEDLGGITTEVDYKALYEKVHTRYMELLAMGDIDVERVALSLDDLRKFSDSPEDEVQALLDETEKVVEELREMRRKLDEVKVKMEAVRALEPEEFKRCIAAGLIRNEIASRFEGYLKRYPDLSSKAVEISPEESFIFIFGPEERRKWIEALYLVFNVRDVFDVLDSGEILLVLDPEKRSEALKGYEEELNKIQGEMAELTIGKIARMDRILNVLSNRRARVLRTKVISVLQGWVPNNKVSVLEKAIDEVESKIGEDLFVWFEDPGHDDHHVPNPAPELQPSFLQPAWVLTTLRGWPDPHEVNPSYLSILIFSFQFGVMFGDVGQGAIFLLLGLIFTWRFKTGMASKIGVLFIPMGIASVIFGFLYGEVFLIEGLIHPILFSPLHHIGDLMKTILGVAVAEICLSHIIASINHIREGDPLGALGQHGLGSILFVVGLYLGGLAFLGGLSISEMFSHWTFYMMLTGLIVAGVIPLVTSIVPLYRKKVLVASAEGQAPDPSCS